MPIIELPPSRYLYVPVDNTRSKSSDIAIKPGDHVYKGQRIGQRHAAFFDQPIFAVVSGTYVGLEKRLYRNNKVIDWIKIENDFKEEVDPAHVERDQAAMDALNKEEAAMLNRYYSAVGLGGSSFPTYIKMNMPNKINTILLNGIECEPYLCADYLAIQNESETIIEAMKFLKRIYECHDIRLCVKPNHPELESIFLRALQKNPDPEIRFQFVKDYYPQGWEIAMIKEATGIQVAPGHLPGEYGIANFNVNTAIQIYNNCKHDMPMLDRYVTVQGDAIVSPCTIRCRVGTPYAELIAAAGGYKDDPREKTLILGGPMMGASVSDDTGIT
ncbi:MAG: SLBB domain-containing protein, partial [Bacilli bacterium]|nr:SLBB domain-containing protein [Bacilli bacterium]